jgi:hypothetical protein
VTSVHGRQQHPEAAEWEMANADALPWNVVHRLLSQGQLLVHDGPPEGHATPDSDKFQTWMARPTSDGIAIPAGTRVCSCGWAPDLDVHYVMAERLWRKPHHTNLEDIIGLYE